MWTSFYHAPVNWLTDVILFIWQNRCVPENCEAAEFFLEVKKSYWLIFSFLRVSSIFRERLAKNHIIYEHLFGEVSDWSLVHAFVSIVFVFVEYKLKLLALCQEKEKSFFKGSNRFLMFLHHPVQDPRTGKQWWYKEETPAIVVFLFCC